MRLQVIQDGKGNPTGVYIPISEWLKPKKTIQRFTETGRV